MEKEPDPECGSSASCMSTGKSKLDTLAKDDLIKFAKKQMAAMQKLKSKCAGLEEKVEALKVNPGGTSNDSVIKELTERMDAVLLEKAETQQMLVLLRKENETLKNQREESVEKVAALQEKLLHAEIDHTEKIKHLEEQFQNSETKYREELEALKKVASENEEIQRHRLQEDFNANIEMVRQEYERKISDLEQNLELTRKELKTENEGLQETHHITLQLKQEEIENLQETISKLSKQHEDEVSYLEEQLEISAADFDIERERLLQMQEELSEQMALKETYLQDVQEEEEDLNRRTQKPSESMEALDSSDPENEMDRLRLAVQDLQSQNTMLNEELTFLTNVKAALEGDLKHLKEEFSMEREELEFKINELQMTKEEGEICPEKEPDDVTIAKETISLEEHNQILQGLKESHKTEMKELETHLASSNEREKEVIAQEAQDLQNKCRVLSEEKNAVVDEYEHTKEILRNIELELGDRTSEFVKKYNAMKEQAAVSVQELEEKLREKDDLIEKLECTQKEMQETLEQKPQHEQNVAPEDKDVHVIMMSDTENLMTLDDVVIYIEKIQEECKNTGVDTARVTLEKLKDLSGALQGALDERKCLRSSESELESRLSHEKDQLAKDLALSNEEKTELQRAHQSASHELDALRKDLEISEEKLSEARRQVCSVLAQNYTVKLHEDEDISTLLEHLLSRVQEEKSACIVLDEEKAKLEKDLGALSEERLALKKVLEDIDRKLSETQKHVCEILEQHFSVNTVDEEDISVLLNHLVSSIHKEKKSYMMLNEEKIKLQGDLVNMVEERDEWRRCVETHEGKLCDARKRVCEILEQNYAVNMDEQQDLSILLEHLLSRGQEDKSTCIMSNEEKLRKLEKDLQSLSKERNDLKKVLEDSGIKFSETQKRVCEILEQHYAVNTVGEEDLSVLLNHLLTSIHEEKKSYMMLNEEKIKLQGDLVNMVKERDELRRCVETHEGKLCDAQKSVCKVLKQTYSVNMDEAEDISVLLEHLLSRGQEEKSTCCVLNEIKAKLEKDLQALSEERNDLRKVLEDSERKLSDTQKHVCEILEQHYAVNMVGEEDISVLLNHLLTSIREEKRSYNEEKMKLQGDLVTVDEEKDHLKRCVETHERNLSDARKHVCEILEQNYAVNMDEQQDLSILLEHLLSRGHEEKSTCIVSKEEKAKLEKDLQALSEERNNLRKVLEDSERKLSDTQKHVCEILEQHYAVNTVGEEDISVLLEHLLTSIREEKRSYNEEKMKLQGDLVTHERNLSDARKGVCKILEQNYSVNMEEERDVSVLLDRLLSRVQEEKLVLAQQLDGKAVQHQQAEVTDAGFLQTTSRNEVLSDTVNSQGDQNQQVEMSGRLVGQEREESAVEGGAQETDDMKSLQQKLSEKESIVAHLKEELSLLQESKLSTLNENMRQMEFLEKESKEKEERLNKFKAVAVKARKELDSSRKEASRLKEELEALRVEKDKMSDSMKAIIHGAESYKNLMIDYDKQTELLDKEREKLEASEKLVVDLNKRLHAAVEQHQQLSSEREDLKAHIETLQSNVRQLEAQALEMHKLKSTLERDLEAERLLKEQKTKEHVCAVKEVEELQSFLQKQKQHLQQTEQELEQLRKDAQQSTLLDMEMADYERLVKELNLQLYEKDRLLEEQERQTQAQREREEKLNQEIESLKSLVDVGEEKTAKVKQLLVKAKKDLADAKKEEASQMIAQSSLKGELESIQQQLENYKIQSSELTADRHRLQEQLKALNDQHQKSVTSYHTQVTTLQNDLSTTKADLESVKSEYNSYKVRVHNVLKQQKNKSSTQSDGDFSKQERENMETMLEQLRSKLQESQLNAQSCNAELQQLQTEYDTLLERHNKMLQQTIAKEAELRERLLSLHSENVALKSEHSQSVAQLTAQTETLRSSFRDQLHHLQDEHRSTVETLQHQINSLENQLFQLQKEPATSAAQQPSKKPTSDRKLADLPLFEMDMAREEGEGMETTEAESLSTAGTPPPSLEQLLSSPDPKHEPFVWQVEPTKEELTNKLSTATRSMEHMNSLLHESEATNAILMEQISLLKSEMRRLERNQEREKSVANLEYLKNVLLQFIFLHAGSEKQALLPVIHTMLQLSPEEKSKLSAIAHGEEEAAASRGSGWTSYLHSWSGIR
ncbi:GRIP and coiled-coil domain-containing protein 2 [Clarias gariepinus]|uniref:GRIP and coiled-coil domain-containing protein 2 n=1 Tax=Clarias gariepinus TaxID=13013 RepID=UPI00234C27F4|nr:GRIP and coiled-coil domain-containing protein 2 [Clarias gariepinus]